MCTLDCGCPSLVIDIWYVEKTLIIMSISTNINRPYVCDP